MDQYTRGYRDPSIPSMQRRITQGVTPMPNTDMAPDGATWHPTVLYLLGLIAAEFALLAALRFLPVVRG